MSDFTSNFWSVFVTALTLVGIIGCAVLLWMAGRKKVVSTADNTTGHVWDEDLVEMNNPLPRWWVWMFVVTIIFGLGSLLGIYVAAGPDFFFDFKKKDYVDRKKAQVALNLGAGVKLLKHLQVGVTYQLPMGDSFTWEEAGKAIGAKNKTWQVSAAYLF